MILMIFTGVSVSVSSAMAGMAGSMQNAARTQRPVMNFFFNMICTSRSC